MTLALRSFLINLLTPYRTSVTPNLSIFQSSVLTKYRSFFAFLQRHAARTAHEVQKAYISTAQWYYETGFRRYVRALEKVRLRSIAKEDPMGVVSNTDGSLCEFGRVSVLAPGEVNRKYTLPQVTDETGCAVQPSSRSATCRPSLFPLRAVPSRLRLAPRQGPRLHLAVLE